MYPFTHLNSGGHIENLLNPRRHCGIGCYLEAHPYCSQGIDTYIATVLSGADSMGEWWAELLFAVFMDFGLTNTKYRKHLLLVRCLSF